MSSTHTGTRAAKISYATEDAAKAAAQRRRAEIGVVFEVYLCKLVRPGSIHPVLRAPHFHIASVKPRQSAHERGHENYDFEVGRRAVGCLLAENRKDDLHRVKIVTQRVLGAMRRGELAER